MAVTRSGSPAPGPESSWSRQRNNSRADAEETQDGQGKASPAAGRAATQDSPVLGPHPKLTGHRGSRL
jgi:hypothetical protein